MRLLKSDFPPPAAPEADVDDDADEDADGSVVGVSRPLPFGWGAGEGAFGGCGLGEVALGNKTAGEGGFAVTTAAAGDGDLDMVDDESVEASLEEGAKPEGDGVEKREEWNCDAVGRVIDDAAADVEEDAVSEKALAAACLKKSSSSFLNGAAATLTPGGGVEVSLTSRSTDEEVEVMSEAASGWLTDLVIDGGGWKDEPEERVEDASSGTES